MTRQPYLTKGRTPTPLSPGALSLINDCVGGKSGERLLIVEEPKGTGFYDDAAPSLTATVARALGMTVYETEAPVGLFNQQAIADFLAPLRGFDHVVFFARAGDQIRFEKLDGFPKATMCYTLGCDMLDSSFGTTCHHGLCDIKQIVDNAFASADDIHVTCPLGTNFRGKPPVAPAASLDVTINRFPMLVPSPVDANGFSGEVVLSRFLIGTGSRFYEPYTLALDSNIKAMVENNTIIRFTGEANLVKRVNEHYEFVAKEFNINPWYVHSWHSGIHPGCSYKKPATDDMMRWSSSAFGNPRLLHFHTCGEYAPGEISWNITDATVKLNGVAIWDNGVLYPERLPGIQPLLEKHSRLIDLYRWPQTDIGI